MATTTPNFGWPVPTSTDLVKDGATAMEALGDAIDTSMVDLKGGTTGQILSKASGTDMDFTWIANDQGDITGVTAGTGISGGGTSGTVTITNSMATEIAAKGDLIVGTGSQTFDNLTAGSNYAFLQADSTTATGLLWDNAAWTSYTPTVTAGSGTFTTVSATGAYKRIGKTVFVRASIYITTNGTAATNVQFTLPFSSINDIQGVFREGAATGNCGIISSNGATAVLRTFTNGYPGGSGYVMHGSLTYEVA